MIFAAGLGTRLRPITDTIPKALAPVGDRTLIEICIDTLAVQGYDDIVINVHHFADKLIAAVDHLRAAFPDVRLRISDERDRLLDTGGAVAFARPLLDGADSFLIHNVDIISNADLSGFHKASKQLMHFSSGQRTDAVLLVYDAPSDRKLLFDGNMRLAGWTDTVRGLFRGPIATGSPDGLTDVSGKPLADVATESGLRSYAFSGIHVMSDGVFDRMTSYGFRGAFPIMDFYLKAAVDKSIAGIVSDGLEVLDVGTPQRLESAAKFLSR